MAANRRAEQKAKEALRVHQTELKDVILLAGLVQFVTACEEHDLITTAVKNKLVSDSTGKPEDDRAFSLLDNIRRSLTVDAQEQLDIFLCVLYNNAGRGGQNLAKRIAQNYDGPLAKFDVTAGLKQGRPAEKNAVSSSSEQISSDTDPPPSKKYQAISTDEVAEDGKSPVYAYPIKGRTANHGLVLVISNEDWIGDKSAKREGTSTDLDAIKKTMEKMNYTVSIKKNLKAAEMKECLSKVGASIGFLSEVDSFICFILSHGNDKGIEGVDKEHVSIAELTESLESNKCSELKGKPKIFFIQACRGTLLPDQVKLDNTSQPQPDEIVMDGKISAIPPGADFFFGYSTVGNNVALRRTLSGSFYIQIICSVFDKYADKLSLHDMMMLVHQTLATDDKYKYDLGEVTYRQMAEMVSTLRGNVFFK